jgi:hypothetical protein
VPDVSALADPYTGFPIVITEGRGTNMAQSMAAPAWPAPFSPQPGPSPTSTTARRSDLQARAHFPAKLKAGRDHSMSFRQPSFITQYDRDRLCLPPRNSPSTSLNA